MKENTGGLPRQVKIVVNHQYDIISNIAVHDGLINGAECCIKYIQEQEYKSNFPAIVWVQFEDNHIGSEQRSKYRYLQKCKSINSDWTPIFAQKSSFLVKKVWVTQVQFPLHPAAACTIHVAQSATFQNIYIDMQTNTNPPKQWWQHMHYVALSRVTSLSGLYLEELNSDKISISPHVAKYLEDARQNGSVKLSYRPTYLYGDENIKVVYNNTRSYRKHYYDIKDNYNLLAADIIFLAETRLTLYDKTENYPIENVHAYRMDQECASKPYHGLIMYLHNNIELLNITMFPGKDIEGIQVVIKKFSKVFTIIGLYSSPHTTVEQIHTFVDNMLSNANDQPIIMIGDFNIDSSVKKNTSFCKFMKSKVQPRPIYETIYYKIPNNN